jgi:AAA+ ATPase superfamily predicted ATPase
MINPFEYGRELGTNELADREKEVAAVIQTVEQGSKLFLVGPRRFGKTSILKTAEDHLIKTGAIVLRFDAESYPSLDLFVSSLIASAAKSLKGTVERVGDQIRSFFSRLRPELSFNLSQDTWNAKIGVNTIPSQNDHVTLLVEALNGLETLAQAQSKDQAVGLIIDEFQKVIELGGTQTESQIRAAIQRHKRVGYVFAGSKTRMLSAMTMDPARPFYRLGSVHFLGPVPAKDFEQFLTSKFRQTGFRVEDEAAPQRILTLAENVPYNVQQLAYMCWNQLRNHPLKPAALLDQQVIDKSMDLIVRQYDPFYTQLWSSLTSIQQKTLLAVIHEQGEKLKSQKVSQLVGKGTSTVQRSLEALADKEILREEEHEGGLRMRFEDPFFAQWICAFRVPAGGLDLLR